MTSRSEVRGPRPPDHSRPEVLYRLRDSAGRLLYVGRTHNFKGRMASHRREHPHWWPAVASIETEDFADFEAADKAEKAAIAAERPALNSMHNAEHAEWRAAGWVRTPVAMPLGPWTQALRVAHARGESIHEVLQAALGQYLEEHGGILDEPAA